ncbi:MAG: collagen binding domain-containing protein, partial [Myxococcales bacterium]
MLATLAGLVWLAWPGDVGAPAPRVGRPARESSNVAPGPRPSVLTAPVATPRGAHTIKGSVIGPSGPVAGAIVTATAGAGEESLAHVPCACEDACGQVVQTCPCTLAAAQLVEFATEGFGEAPPLARATTSADGTFVLAGLAPGNFDVWADVEGLGVAHALVEAGTEGVQLAPAGGAVLQGTVDFGPEPVAGVRVVAHHQHERWFETTASANGGFRFPPLPHGVYTLVAQSPGRLSDTATVSAGASAEVTLTLSLPRRLGGLVLRDGVAVAGVEVGLEGEHRRMKTRSDAAGRFTFEGLRPGEYELEAVSGDAFARDARLLLRESDDRKAVLNLIPAARLRV